MQRGQRCGNRSTVPHAGWQRSTSTNHKSLPTLPAIKRKTRAAESAVVEKSQAGGKSKATLAEIEAKIREMSKIGMGYGNMRRFGEWQKFMDSIDPADMPATLAFLDRVGSKNVQMGLRGMLLNKWAETDLNAAMAYANSVAGTQSRNMAIMSVVQGWAEKDADAAMAWAKQLPAGQLRNQVLNATIGSLAAKDPAGAFDLMKNSGINNQFGGGMYQIFNAWAEKDPAGAAAKAAELSGNQRSQAFQSIASSWATKDPLAAITWANTLPNPGAGMVAGNCCERSPSRSSSMLRSTRSPNWNARWLRRARAGSGRRTGIHS